MFTTAHNYQSGSNYRLINAPAVLQGTDLIATFVSGTTQFQWNPIFVESLGTKFRTYSVFANDNWTINDRLTANLGLRWDRNDGVDSNELLVARNAGVPSIAVPFGYSDVGIETLGPNRIIYHYDELTPELVEGLLAA